MDKRTAIKKIISADSKHQAHPVANYLKKAMLCNNYITLRIVDGLVAFVADNGQVCPYVPKSQSFAIWVDEVNLEATFKLDSLVAKFM